LKNRPSAVYFSVFLKNTSQIGFIIYLQSKETKKTIVQKPIGRRMLNMRNHFEDVKDMIEYNYCTPKTNGFLTRWKNGAICTSGNWYYFTARHFTKEEYTTANHFMNNF